MGTLTNVIAIVCLVWALAVITVQTIGISAIFRYFSKPQSAPISSKLGQGTPSVTIIRPVKGLEPQLYNCLAATFLQDYQTDKLSIRFCVEDVTDPAYPILQRLIRDFPAFDARVLVETQDPVLHGANGRVDNLGPNPKIRNISRAYREANGDIIWIIDCNVWVGSGVLGRMVDKLMGFAPQGVKVNPYKFVHQMPLVVDLINYQRAGSVADDDLLNSAGDPSEMGIYSGPGESKLHRVWKHGGGRLDEMFMATTHVKFYGAINSVGVAPCIVGKSNMFRKTHLEQITDPARNPILPKDESRPSGVDYFSHNICEDHLIGDLLWRSKIPGYKNHGIVWGDLVIQPMAGMSISAYAARRCRWLRARKFTVLAATLVEPGVESLLCCAYLSYAMTSLSWFQTTLGIPQTWAAMTLLWLCAVLCWMVVDWHIFRLLHSGKSIHVESGTPQFARGTVNPGGSGRRPFLEWFLAWLGRECMALPIWTWAVLCGTTIRWRGKTFHVNLNASVVEVLAGSKKGVGTRTPELERARQSSKDRLD